MAQSSQKTSANRVAKIKAIFSFMCVPYLVAAVAVAWKAFTTPALGELEKVNMQGKRVLITGATSGLGLRQAEMLASWNATLILPVRDMKKGKALASKLQEEHPGAPPPVILEMDLASLESVRDFAEQYKGPVDVLVHNAAVLGTGELVRTEDGFEECLQVNYLSTFLLTSLLLPRLEESSEGRIVYVSAMAHEWGKVSLEDLRRKKVLEWDFPKRKMRMLGNLGGSYADSKLAQVLFTRALARRLPENVVIHSLHPAISATGGEKETFQGPEKYLHAYIMTPVSRWIGFMQSEEDAPKTQIHVSTHPSLQAVSGRYYSSLSPPLVNCGRQAEDCGMASISETASDRLLQEELLGASCELLGLTDGFCAPEA